MIGAARSYLIQRLTALILAPLVLAHLVLIIYAVRDGLSAEEILARTQGSVGWALFYATFVIAAAAHAGIGIRNVLVEWTPIGPRAAAAAAHALGLIMLLLGLRAVYAVVS